MPDFNNRIKQVLLLSLIILLIFLTVKELFVFLPGLLGALTLYILSRGSYFRLIDHRKWKKGLAAGLFVFYYILIIGLPVFIAILLVSPKINDLLANRGTIIQGAKASIAAIQQKIGFELMSESSITDSINRLSAIIPNVLNSTANLISNFALMLFILYYMLCNGRDIERILNRIIPLKQENINMLADETKTMVKANALGIPLISIIQGLTASLGYFIFGVNDWGLWGFLTGVFAFFPVVGTMIIWVPLVLYLYALDQNWQATAVLLYSLIVTGNVDYLARMTLLKRMGNVHPVVTILGVLVGLGLFGFIGLVFGPLLISYIVLLFNIYMNEFVGGPPAQALTQTAGTDNESVEAGE